jgi:hypothetical protein
MCLQNIGYFASVSEMVTGMSSLFVDGDLIFFTYVISTSNAVLLVFLNLFALFSSV